MGMYAAGLRLLPWNSIGARACRSWVMALLVIACQADARPYVSSQISPTTESPRRVILDVDPGIDDAIAILLALRSPELKVQALTTVAGNVTVDRSSENALRVLALARRTDIPVARGAARPLRKELVTATYGMDRTGSAGSSYPGRMPRSTAGTPWI